MDRYYVKIPLLVFVLRLDHYDLCVVRQLWLVINDVLWYQFCYVSQKRYFWDCDVRHNGHHLDLKIRVLTSWYQSHCLTLGALVRMDV